MWRSAGLLSLIGLVVTIACSGGGDADFGVDRFTAELRAKKISPELTDKANSLVLDREGLLVMWEDISVGAFEYPDRVAAKAAAALIDEDGSRLDMPNAPPINWPATPHFFRKGSLIVLYVGDNRPALDTLRFILGAQFAGGYNIPIPQ